MAKKRRGGRQPGKWELVDPLEFRRWRDQNKLSRARLAGLMGVSSTSIQNWETGNAVPSPRYQERLAELMKDPAVVAAAPARRGGGALGGRAADGGSGVMATGEIVTAYLKSSPELAEEELVALIRAVRQALS
jgi:DNA-binding transcriptional regulator YiaG